MESWVAEYGLWAVFAAAFVAATIVPISSEVAVLTALASDLAPGGVFVAASVGNGLGALTSYGLGRVFSDRSQQKLQASRAGVRALAWAERYGGWSLLGAWLPIVGDPLCLAAGLFGIRWTWFLAFGVGTRVLRYVPLVAGW